MARPSIALLILGAAAMTGCGGAPIASTLRVETPLDAVVRAHKALLVSGASANVDYAADARAIAAQIAPKLRRTGYFSAVIDEEHARETQTDLELRITLVDLVRVTARERQGRGDGAGEVKVVASLRLVDKASGSELGKASIVAAGYKGPRGGTTEDAEDEVARRVIELISGRPEGG
jgi:hypothetical protein